MNFRYLILLLTALTSINCTAQITVKVSDPHIRYTGRIAMTDTAAELSWSATDIKVNFNGTGISTTLRDERSDNHYNVIVDGKVVNVLHPAHEKKNYVLASDLPAGNHTLELFKRTEWAMGKTWFYGFTLDKGAKVLPSPATKKRKIEFFGKSITCGYADINKTRQDRGT